MEDGTDEDIEENDKAEEVGGKTETVGDYPEEFDPKKVGNCLNCKQVK